MTSSLIWHLHKISNKYAHLKGIHQYETSLLQWNMYNDTGNIFTKTHQFDHLPNTIFAKSCLFSLLWKTTCLQRPQTSVVTLYRFHCIPFCFFENQTNTYIMMAGPISGLLNNKLLISMYQDCPWAALPVMRQKPVIYVGDKESSIGSPLDSWLLGLVPSNL